MKEINLLKYFTIKHKHLSKKYIKECEKYIKWLGVDKKAFARGYRRGRQNEIQVQSH